jgi:H+/Cl- antiporter ClcA
MMNADNRVRPVVRVASAILTVFFAAGAILSVVFILSTLSEEGVSRWPSWRHTLIFLVLLLPSVMMARYFFYAARTGQNPPWDEDDDESNSTPAA